MIRADYHLHTTFSDGKNTPEEMVTAAIEKGFTEIGFSDHSFTAFDTSYCMQKADIDRYIAEISALRQRYADRIRILCGIEQDYYATFDASRYDYAIGSVHYIKGGDEYIDTDDTAEKLQSGAARHFGGDIYALIEEYYRTVSDVVQKTDCRIIGHFDLIAKLNEKTPFFDAAHPRYRAAWQQAADRLLKTGVPFEINVGAVWRGTRSVPYPAPDILAYLKERGASFVLSSDAHKKEYIGYRFDEYEKSLLI